MSKREKEEWRANISFMFQNNALFDSLTVFENISMPLLERVNMNTGQLKKELIKLLTC